MIRHIFSPRFAILTILTLLTAGTLPARAGWGVGVSIGGPFCCRPCFGPCIRPCFGFSYYSACPVYVAPPPPVYVPAVAVVEHAPVVPVTPVAPTTTVAPAAAISPTPVPTVARASGSSDIDCYAQQLQHPDPKERAEAAVQLGRLHASGYVTALTATLNNDRSPLVREAAARGLGLMGSTDCLDALQRVASSDEDRDVRHSASYAADVIRASLRR